MRQPTSMGLLVAVIMFTTLAGCVPGRKQYYARMKADRQKVYRRWKRQRREDLPQIKGSLPLSDAVVFALQFNPNLKAMVAEKMNARGRTMEARSEALPKFDVSVSYARLDQITTVDLGVDSFQIGNKDNYSYQFEITQPIFKGGRMLIAQRAARLFSYLTREQIRQAATGVIYDVTRAYYQAVLARHQIKVQKQALESARAQLEAVQDKENQGVATEFDVLRARVDVSNIKAELIEEESSYDSARANLLKAMGASQRSSVSLNTELSYDPIDAPDFEEAVEIAFQHRSNIYEKSISRDLNEESLKNVYAEYFPDIKAYFWKKWAKPDPHQASSIDWGDQYQGGIRLTWPIFDGLAREGRLMQQKAQLRQALLKLFNAEHKVLRDVDEALSRLKSTRQLVESQKLNLKRADRALSLVQAGYKQGINTSLEVLDARTALTEARGLYYRALHQHTMARINLQKALGLLGPRPGGKPVPDAESVPVGVIQTGSGGAGSDSG